MRLERRSTLQTSKQEPPGFGYLCKDDTVPFLLEMLRHLSSDGSPLFVIKKYCLEVSGVDFSLAVFFIHSPFFLLIFSNFFALSDTHYTHTNYPEQ